MSDNLTGGHAYLKNTLASVFFSITVGVLANSLASGGVPPLNTFTQWIWSPTLWLAVFILFFRLKIFMDDCREDAWNKDTFVLAIQVVTTVVGWMLWIAASALVRKDMDGSMGLIIAAIVSFSIGFIAEFVCPEHSRQKVNKEKTVSNNPGRSAYICQRRFGMFLFNLIYIVLLAICIKEPNAKICASIIGVLVLVLFVDVCSSRTWKAFSKVLAKKDSESEKTDEPSSTVPSQIARMSCFQGCACFLLLVALLGLFLLFQRSAPRIAVIGEGICLVFLVLVWFFKPTVIQELMKRLIKRIRCIIHCLKQKGG